MWQQCSCERVFVSRFEVNQWHEGFGDHGVDEVYVGCAVLGTSSTMQYGVGRGLSQGCHHPQ